MIRKNAKIRFILRVLLVVMLSGVVLTGCSKAQSDKAMNDNKDTTTMQAQDMTDDKMQEKRNTDADANDSDCTVDTDFYYQNDVKASADSSRNQVYPIESTPSILRRMLYTRLIQAFEHPESIEINNTAIISGYEEANQYLRIPLTMKYDIKDGVLAINSEHLKADGIKVETSRENGRTIYSAKIAD